MTCDIYDLFTTTFGFANHDQHTSMEHPRMSKEFTKLPNRGFVERYLASAGATIALTIPGMSTEELLRDPSSTEEMILEVPDGAIVLVEDYDEIGVGTFWLVSIPRHDEQAAVDGEEEYARFASVRVLVGASAWAVRAVGRNGL